jgi:hypothetical protein
VQGFLDVLEDRLLLENPKVYLRTTNYDAEKDWKLFDPDREVIDLGGLSGEVTVRANYQSAKNN